MDHLHHPGLALCVPHPLLLTPNPSPRAWTVSVIGQGGLSWLLGRLLKCHLMQVLGMLAVLGLSSVTLILFLWQGATSFTSHRMFPEEVPSWSWETLKGDAEQQNNSCQ